MPHADFSITQNDTSPAIEAFLKDDDGVNVSLVGATVTFSMRVAPSGAVKVNKQSCSLVDDGNGEIKYQRVAADTDTADTYEAEFEVVYSGGLVETFPNDSYINVVVKDDVA